MGHKEARQHPGEKVLVFFPLEVYVIHLNSSMDAKGGFVILTFLRLILSYIFSLILFHVPNMQHIKNFFFFSNASVQDIVYFNILA